MIQMVAARALALLKKPYRYVRRRAVMSRRRGVEEKLHAGNALQGKVALVTGASSGIGYAIAAAFARAGARCILVAIDREAGSRAGEALLAEGLLVELHIADVSDADVMRALARSLAVRFPCIDILVNNAGVFLPEDRAVRASELRDDILERTLAVNLFGAIHTSRAFIPLLPRGGRIINVSSVMGQLSGKHDGLAAAYRASKAALNSFTQSLAADLKSQRVMVDCFHPGWVKTALGGPDAKIQPDEATATAFFLATRPPTNATGLFWWDCETIGW
jgi:NAD(P)-dependent dehydrogenase (short-subunit alcohol dehydrogenase family)